MTGQGHSEGENIMWYVPPPHAKHERKLPIGFMYVMHNNIRGALDP